MNFESWYTSLISDTLWYELLHHYKSETIKKAGEKVYASLVADGTTDVRPMSENRKHVYNILCKNPGDKINGKAWYVQEAEKKEAEQEKEWVPVSEEERARRLKEYKALIDSMPILNNFPRLTPKEKEENGEWIAVKHVPYPTTSEDEAYLKDRHFNYIKQNYEARTGLPSPTWISEEQFNLSYPNKYIMNFLTKAKDFLSPKDLKLINVDDLETSHKNITKRIRLYRDEVRYSNDQKYNDAKLRRIEILRVIADDLRLLMEAIHK